MKVWIDCDGVIADFTGPFLRDVVKPVTGRTYHVHEITNFHFDKCILSRKESAACWDRVRVSNGWVGSFDALPYAREFVGGLRELPGVDLKCVTASPPRSPYWKYERERWLGDFGFEPEDIIFCEDKKWIPADIIVEDRLETVREWCDAHPQGFAVLIEQPWNQGDVPDLCTRAYDLNWALRLVQTLARRRAP